MFKPQKALHLHIEEDKKKPKFVDRAYAIYEKYDGWYGYFDSEDGVIKSRAGREIPSVAHLNERLRQHVQKGVLIFEILLDDVTLFKDLNGVLNRKAPAPTAYLKVHDFYDKTLPQAGLSKRTAMMYEIVEAINSSRVRPAPILGVSSNPETWKAKADLIMQAGGEGIILKAIDAPISQDKRNADLMKIKMEVTLDLLVVSLVRGDGKYAGTLGALRCVDRDGSVHMISGMSDAQRAEWWYTPSLIVNHVVEVQAMCQLPNGSLREPRFKAVRYDKAPKDID